MKILKIYLINLSVGLFCYLPFTAIFIKRFYESSIHGTWLRPVTNLGQLHDVLKWLVNDKHLASDNFFPITNYKQIDTLKLRNADKVIFIDAAAEFNYPGNGIKAKLDSSFNLKQQYEIFEIYRIYEYTN